MTSRALPPRRLTALALTVALIALIAGCGSSSSGGSSITVGAEPNGQSSTDNAPAPSAVATAQTSTASTPSIATPTSGPLSTQPKVAAPSGAAPKALVVRDLIKGNGAVAKPGATVTVNYVGVLFHGGKMFDASWNRHQPFSFPLGQGRVIPGWDQGVAGMKVGGRRELIIPSALAYGAAGSPPTIPPNAPLVFVVDLLGA